MFWRPNKEEITEWLGGRNENFPENIIGTHGLNDEQWLQRYVFTDLHEIFFGEFSDNFD
jgi:hypothetical protein